MILRFVYTYHGQPPLLPLYTFQNSHLSLCRFLRFWSLRWEVNIGKYIDDSLFWPALEDGMNELQYWRSKVTEWRSATWSTELRSAINVDIGQREWLFEMEASNEFDDMIRTFTQNQDSWIEESWANIWYLQAWVYFLEFIFESVIYYILRLNLLPPLDSSSIRKLDNSLTKPRLVRLFMN